MPWRLLFAGSKVEVLTAHPEWNALWNVIMECTILVFDSPASPNKHGNGYKKKIANGYFST